MQIRILIPLAASVLLVGCSSLGGAGGSGAGMIDCPPDADAADGYVGNPATKIVVVVGHTDSTGTDAYNQDLSERRAKSVADYLTTKLVGLDIASVGRGETKPVASNDTALGRAKNRRVEVVVIGSKTEMQK